MKFHIKYTQEALLNYSEDKKYDEGFKLRQGDHTQLKMHHGS